LEWACKFQHLGSGASYLKKRGRTRNLYAEALGFALLTTNLQFWPHEALRAAIYLPCTGRGVSHKEGILPPVSAEKQAG
jgi:hypothetical protein